MNRKLFHLFFAILLVCAGIVGVSAQDDSRFGNGKPSQEPFSKSVKESIARGRIEREKKEYEELIKRGEESAKLSEELQESFLQNNRFTSEDQKKLERLEKNLKKIRSELGGGDDDQVEDILSLQNAIKTLQTQTANLLDELKKTSRYTISAAAIESSNAILQIVKFIRTRKN